MGRSRTKNVINNINSGVINRVIHLVFQFIVRTVMISTLGAEYLGLNSLFTSILQVLSVAELGFGSAVVYSMFKPFAENDEDKICKLLGFYRRAYHIVGIVIFCSGILLIPFLPYLTHGSYPTSINIYVIYMCYLINTSLGYFLFAYKGSLFSADQRGYVQNNIKTVVNVFMYVAQMVVLILVKDYYIYIVFLPISTIIINLVQESISKKEYPSIHCKDGLDEASVTELKKQVIGLVSYKIGGVIFENVDVVIISSFIGLAVLAKYTNYYYVIMGLNAVLAIIQSGMTASVGNSIVTETLEKNKKQFMLLNNIYDWIIGWFAVCCMCLFQPFMILWMGEKNLLSLSTVILMSVYFYLCNLQPALLVYKNAAGIWWQDRIRPIVSAIFNIILNVILVQIWGVNGVLLASILITVFINVPVSAYYVFKNYLKIDIVKYLMSKLTCFVIAFIIGILTYCICVQITYENVFVILFWRTVVCVLLPNICFFVISLITGQWTEIKGFALNIIKRSR